MEQILIGIGIVVILCVFLVGIYFLSRFRAATGGDKLHNYYVEYEVKVNGLAEPVTHGIFDVMADSPSSAYMLVRGRHPGADIREIAMKLPDQSYRVVWQGEKK